MEKNPRYYTYFSIEFGKHILYLKMCFLVDLFFLVNLFFLINFLHEAALYRRGIWQFATGQKSKKSMIAITISIWFSWFYFFQILQYFVTTTTTQSYQTSKCETASKEVFQSILFINSGFKWWVWMYLKVHFRIRFFWNSNSCKNLLT